MFDHDIPYTQLIISEEGKEIGIDGRKRSSISRFIRHSCKPNSKITIVSGLYSLLYKLSVAFQILFLYLNAR